MSEFDVIVRDGTIVDGSGAPRVRGDLAIQDGRVAGIGRFRASQGKREIDASGAIVAPGFVDLHTHYDAQIFWDPYCSMSGWHGVTSVVLGNCGFGFAPVAPEFRERAMQSMTRVEAIPFETMKQGMPWDWETFPEFLDSLDRIPKAVNVQALAPLTPIMVTAMGLERAKAGELPSEAEHAHMRELLHDAMRAGAGGWSAQRTTPDSGYTVQRDFDGTPMVTDVMHDETMFEMADVLGEYPSGFVQTTLVKATPAASFETMEKIAARSGRPLIHNVILVYGKFPEGHRQYTRWVASCRERGIPVYGQCVTNCAGFWYDFTDWNLFDEVQDWAEATSGSLEEKRHKLADPARREALRKNQPYTVTVPIKMHVITETHLPENERFRGRTLAEAAEMLGCHPVDAMLDIAVSEDLRTEFYGALPNDGYQYLDELLSDPSLLPGVSDGGAHTKFTTAGRYTTELLISAVRDRQLISLEEAHWRLSALPAHCAGFRDRGMLRVGAPADIVIYDMDRLEVLPMEKRSDLPAGEWRRVQKARGYRFVLVNGEPTIQDDEMLKTSPGRLLRHGLG